MTAQAARADTHRAAVYGAEDQVLALLERGGPVDFHGSLLDLPAERRFGDLDGVRRYIAAVRAHAWGHPGTPEPVVVASRSDLRARWRSPDRIEVPDRPRWALRELVVLHEYAHHVAAHTRGCTDHSRPFCEVHVELVSRALSPAVGTLLLAGYAEAGAW